MSEKASATRLHERDTILPLFLPQVQVCEFTELVFPHLLNREKMSRHPTVKWAQRSDKLFITVELPDAEDVKLKLEPDGKFFFSATVGADKTPYEVDLHLFDKVDVTESKAHVGSRIIRYILKKADAKWWSRLTRQPGKPPVFLKVDWEKWIDQDDENTSGLDDTHLREFDFSKMNIVGEGAVDAVAEDEDEDENKGDEKEP